MVGAAETSIYPAIGFGDRLHVLIRSIETTVDRWASSWPLVICVFSLIYAIPTAQIAERKLFWDDEFFTLYLSTVSSWHELLRALATGADQHPPSFYYLTHLCIKLLGCTPVTVRLPEIFGFWLFCVALYALVRRLLRPIWGVVAMMLPLTSGAYYYASEARGYGLMLGFSALALYAWFELTAGGRRVVFLPILAMSSAATVASHYYGVLAMVALGIGELVRTVIRKSLDVWVWTAFAGSVLPLLIFLSTIRSANRYSSHFWAHPVWSDVFRFYPHLFGYTLDVLLGSIAAAILIALVSQRGTNEDRSPRPVGISWAIAALLALAITPVFAMILAKFATHGFTDRYAIIALIGTSVLITYAIRAVGRQRTAAAAAAILLSGLCFYVTQWELKTENQRVFDDLKSDYDLLVATHNEPVAVAEITLFHRLSFYAPPNMSRRLSYLADPDASVEYVHQDTVDRGLLELRPWFPLQVVRLNDYVTRHTYFLAFGYIGDWSWLTFRLPEVSAETKLLTRRGFRLLLAVKAPALANGAHTNPERMDSDLFNTLTTNGHSLCQAYFGASHCPVL